MNYTNVSVNAQGQAPILTDGQATMTSLGLNCRTFVAGRFPVVGTTYAIHATDANGQPRAFDYKCETSGATSLFF